MPYRHLSDEKVHFPDQWNNIPQPHVAACRKDTSEMKKYTFQINFTVAAPLDNINAAEDGIR